MNKYLIILMAVFFTASCMSAKTEAQMKVEIDSLLSVIKQSDCEFERNGKRYQSAEAIEHINKKYDYYEDDINSAEKFIELAASKSMLSSKSYLIHCPNQASVTSKSWLLDQLSTIRNKSGAVKQSSLI